MSKSVNFPAGLPGLYGLIVFFLRIRVGMSCTYVAINHPKENNLNKVQNKDHMEPIHWINSLNSMNKFNGELAVDLIHLTKSLIN